MAEEIEKIRLPDLQGAEPGTVCIRHFSFGLGKLVIIPPSYGWLSSWVCKTVGEKSVDYTAMAYHPGEKSAHPARARTLIAGCAPLKIPEGYYLNLVESRWGQGHLGTGSEFRCWNSGLLLSLKGLGGWD